MKKFEPAPKLIDGTLQFLKDYYTLEQSYKLLKADAIPKLTVELAKISGMEEIHNDPMVIREVMFAFSAGDFSQPIRIGGIIPGCMKALQSRLRNLIWQVERLEQGDFTQRVEFMGEFSEAFNRMTIRLDTAIKKLQEREKDLKVLADNLCGAASSCWRSIIFSNSTTNTDAGRVMRR
ncbi:MAG: hypothetical protein LBB98_04255 [Treponema sp.]|nr:hypothetical protein [Treponema sp.]